MTPELLRTRPVELDDAAELSDALAANRAFLAPWEPARAESWFTEAGQRAALESFLQVTRVGLARGHVIVDDDGAIVGRINIANVIRGAFDSCHVGYWVAESVNGRGYASQAVAEMVDVAFDDLALHRLEASTLPHNAGSQRVLTRNGFIRIGRAPHYLQIAGRWQDHDLFQLTREQR